MGSEALARAHCWAPEQNTDITAPSELPTWFHDSIHDVESVWWVALWSILYFTVESGHLPLNGRERFELMFTPSTIHTARTGFGDNTLVNNIGHHPVANQALARSIAKWMWSIVTSYRDYEKEHPQKLNPDALKDIHAEGNKWIQEIFKTMTNQGWATETLKRTWTPEPVQEPVAGDDPSSSQEEDEDEEDK